MADAVLNQLSAANIFDLRGVVAVVTGGGTGIGLMISSTLLANGATVYIIGPNQVDLDKVAGIYNEAAEKTGRPGRVYGLAGDVRSKSEALRLADEVGKREKHVTALFNNAGVLAGVSAHPTANTAEAFRSAYLDAITPEHFANSLNTNAVGPYWLTFAFLPLLEKWKAYESGNRRFAPQVIMTSSMNGWTKDINTAGRSYPYMFSKAAIGQATATLAHELLPLGIRVNGIAPGLFQTEMTAPGTADAVGQSHIPEGAKQEFEVPATQPALVQGGRAPYGGSNRDMGSLALFLVGNWFVNGETVLIDGGTMLLHPSSY
ncbi:NAD-P-binding protein [Rhodofomes roseus]|uniref:NAD-P-binding protein n=1 Tax=Rhodofomes roseus TaxID=34475 RepID=A0ABQ8KEE3_9APHY|nr:NAD-P-binding protein [Rhodofomes roseus]KAH9836113.1 NAD-P-binding protein [Rhodofomes roseus]